LSKLIDSNTAAGTLGTSYTVFTENFDVSDWGVQIRDVKGQLFSSPRTRLRSAIPKV